MNTSVERALSAAMSAFAQVIQQDGTTVISQLKAVFETDANFLEKVNSLDAVFDDFPAFDELREVAFDLLMINFFNSDVKKLEEDYLDSPEWEAIEEQTIDRGTELLNLLLYIHECHDEQIKPQLDDFLKEFLLIDEDEFQDEFHIYEDLISNQQLAESSVEDICNNARLLQLTEEMETLFVPFMTFFLQANYDAQIAADLMKYSNNKGFDVAVYTLIATFNKK